MFAGAAVQPLGCLSDDVSPGFDVRKDPGEEITEPGNVFGIRSIHRSAVRIACGSGDVVVGAGGSEFLGGEVEDAVVEGEEVVVGVETIEEGEGGVEVQGRDLGADRGPEAAISQPLGNDPGNGDSRRCIVVLVLLLGGPDSLGCLRSLFEEGNELGGEEVLDGRRVGELHPLDAIKVVVVVALVGAEPNVGVWKEGAEGLGDADVATLQKNTLKDGVLGAAPSVNLVGVGTVGPCYASQPVLRRTLSVTREGSPLGGGDSRVILVGEPAPVVPEGFVLEATCLQSKPDAKPTIVVLGTLWAEHVQAGDDVRVDAGIPKSLIVGDRSEPVGVALSGVICFLLVLFALAHLFEGVHEGVGDGGKVDLPRRDLPLLVGRRGDDEEARGLDSVAFGARDGADVHRKVVSGIVLELPSPIGEGDSVALGRTPEDVVSPLARGLSCR